MLWLLVALVTALSSLAGYVFFDDASGSAIAFVLAFAAGAILTMLADTMMPEAFDARWEARRARDDVRFRGRVRDQRARVTRLTRRVRSVPRRSA